MTGTNLPSSFTALLRFSTAKKFEQSGTRTTPRAGCYYIYGAWTPLLSILGGILYSIRYDRSEFKTCKSDIVA